MVNINEMNEDQLWAMRKAIFGFMIDKNVQRDVAVQVLSQCANALKDSALVEAIAKIAGYELEGYRVDAALEIYYDVKKDDRDLGYISKGWTDPGFRIGEFLIFDSDAIHKFRMNSDSILNICSSQLVSCGARLENDELILELTIPIYEGGLNPQTMKAAFDHLAICTNQVKEMVSK